MRKLYFEDFCIHTAHDESAYRDICRHFREVNAAGGLVTDGRGRFLIIKRNGIWDLPKGHQDPGEDISTTALREVCEETGIQSPELGPLICITDHCYLRDGVWHLKHTWWYSMRLTSAQIPAPQSEEGITEAVWMDEAGLEECLAHTYPSIKEVFVKRSEQKSTLF